MTECFDSSRRRLLGMGGALALAGSRPTAARAQGTAAFPSRPVRLVVPFTPGGAADVLMRLLQPKLQEAWQQPVLVENKPGGSTILGTDLVAKSPPDGHTLLVATSAFQVNPSLQPSLPYDTLRDFAAVTQLTAAYFALFAHPTVEANTLPELIALAKKNPGKLSYASPGIATGPHLTAELLKSMAGIDLLHVPYKGFAQAQQDVFSGRVPLLSGFLGTAMPFIRQGRLKAIAVSSPQRLSVAPEVQTFAETLPGFSAVSVVGVVAPSGTPRAVIERLSADFARAVRSPDVVEHLAQRGDLPAGSTPAQYDALIRSEIEQWGKVIRSAGIRAE